MLAAGIAGHQQRRNCSLAQKSRAASVRYFADRLSR